MDSVVIMGVSAGAFGAALNFDLAEARFGTRASVTLVSDSGPLMSAEFVAPCLQARFRETWGLDKGALRDCGAACDTPDGSFLEERLEDLVSKHPDRNLAFLSHREDSVIRLFWSFGEDDCAAIDGFPVAYSAERFEEGLLDIRDRVLSGRNNAKVWLAPGEEHIFLFEDPWDQTVGDEVLSDWILKAVVDDPTWDNVPEPASSAFDR